MLGRPCPVPAASPAFVRFRLPARFLCILALLGSAPCWATSSAVEKDAANTITWLMPDSLSVGGGAASLGFSNQLVDYLAQALPQVHHRKVVANVKRSWQMLAHGEPVCVSSAVRTPERASQAYFLPAQWVLPPQLIVRQDRLAALPRAPGGEVDLPALMRQARLRGALFEGRSYGRAIDEQLAQEREASPRMNHYAQAGAADKLLQMLRLDRADYTIDYDFALKLVAKEEALAPGAALLSLPILGASEPVIGSLACPRNAWGWATLLRIGQVLAAPAGTQFLRERMAARLSPEARRQHSHRLEQFYKDRSQRSRPQ